MTTGLVAGCGSATSVASGCSGRPTAKHTAQLLVLFGAAHKLTKSTVCAHLGEPNSIRTRNGQAIGAVEGGPGDAQFDGLKFDIAAWSDHEVATAAKYAASSRSNFRTGVLLILALPAGAVLTAGVVALRLARSTRRAVQEIGAAAKAISEGDIDQHVVVHSRDEFGDMAAHFDAMVGYLRSTVGVAEQIADGKLDVEVRPRSERDMLGRSLQTMIGSLRRVTLENSRLLSISRAESTTDALTELGNRRALNADLVEVMDAAGRAQEATLAIFDLDGFKAYNDTFGHPAGDALLARLGVKLRDSAGEHARAYRMGDDEFCLLIQADEDSADAHWLLSLPARSARSVTGSQSAIPTASYECPPKPSSGETALQLADQRLYAHKGARRSSAQRQSRDVLMQVLREHTPQLGDHMQGVRELAEAVIRKLGGDEAEVERVGITADLHDIGKMV